MLYEPQVVLDRLIELADEVKLEKTIDGVIYRDDYQDYQVILDDAFHCEIREKLIDIFMKDPKHGDTRREIVFLLMHPAEYEEWEEGPAVKPPSDIDIEID